VALGIAMTKDRLFATDKNHSNAIPNSPGNAFLHKVPCKTVNNVFIVLVYLTKPCESVFLLIHYLKQTKCSMRIQWQV